MSDEIKQLKMMELRETMKGNIQGGDAWASDQQEGRPRPSTDRPHQTKKNISLPRDFEKAVINNSFLDILNLRASRRVYKDQPLTLRQLAFLLWSAQGVKRVTGTTNPVTLRTVPSAGARHPLEAYVYARNVDGLNEGLYHYLAPEHRLEFLNAIENAPDRISAALSGQVFAGYAPAILFLTAIPYRTEWRYVTQAAKYILLDAGHAAQNVYLACEAMGLGTCAIGAYDQSLTDSLMNLPSGSSCDPEDEFVIYAMPVGVPSVK